MTEFLCLLGLCIVTLSATMTAIKKINPEKDAPKPFYWGVALVISSLMGYGIHLYNDFGMGGWSVLIYILAIYSLQYFVSQKMLDKCLKRILGVSDD